MSAQVAWVISSLHQILIYLCQMLVGLHLFTPVVTLLNIVLYRRTGIAQDLVFVTISLDKSKRILLAAMSVFNITLLFPNIIGMSSFLQFCMCCWQDNIGLFNTTSSYVPLLSRQFKPYGIHSHKYEILIARHFCHINFSFYNWVFGILCYFATFPF